MKKALLILLLLGAVGGYVYWPYYTVTRLEDAFRAADQNALERLIDFPLVRQSLKEQMKAKVAGESAGDSKDPSAAARSAAAVFTGAVADRVIDSLVTPSTITKFLKLEAAVGASARFTLREQTWHSPVEFSAKSADASRFVFRRQGIESWRVVSIEPGEMLGRQVQIPR